MDDVSNRTREILKKVRQIEIRTRRLVTDSMSGAYHSAFKGQGMDFEEVREYAPGDEVRSIDWNVTAKMGEPFIKLYREERELTIMLAVDVSASGLFGSTSQSKKDLTAEIASVLALAATNNNDKVGLLLFSDKVEKFITPKKGRQHILRIVREILYFEPENKGTNISHALQYINQVLKRKAIVFMVSDFLSNDNQHEESLSKLLKLTNKKHDLSCITLADKNEEELPNVGIVSLEDAETGTFVEIDTSSSKIRELYRKNNIIRKNTLKQTFKKAGVDSIELLTGQSYIVPLRNYLASRAQRL